MLKKKEIIIIIAILAFTIALGFLPRLISCDNSSVAETTAETENKELITIKITGEVSKSDLSIKVPYGSSYGYIIQKIKLYLNKYSIIDDILTTRYYKDTTIDIKSSDINKSLVDSSEGKININSASKSELQTLYGIGEKRADTIISYRKTKKIESFDELRDVIGVSNEIIEKIKECAVL